MQGNVLRGKIEADRISLSSSRIGSSQTEMQKVGHCSGFMGKMRKLVKRPSSPACSPDPPGRRLLFHHLLWSRTLCLHPQGTEEGAGGGRSESGVIRLFFCAN